MNDKDKTKERRKSNYAYNRAISKRISEFTKIVLIARNFDVNPLQEKIKDTSQKGGASRKKRAHAFLTDKELQVSLYLAQTRLRKKYHHSKGMLIKNQTMFLLAFEKYVGETSYHTDGNSKFTAEKVIEKSNEALISRTLKKLSQLELIQYEIKNIDIKDRRKTQIRVTFPKLQKTEYHVELMRKASKK